MRKKRCCVYAIYCTLNQKAYIGATVWFESRKLKHLLHLRRNEHHCKHLQAIFNKYGEENIQFIILEDSTPELVYSLEREWWLSWPESDRVAQGEPSGERHTIGITGKGQSIILVDLYGNILKTFKGIYETASTLNIAHTTVLAAIKRGRSYVNPIFRTQTREVFGWVLLEESYENYNDWIPERNYT